MLKLLKLMLILTMKVFKVKIFKKYSINFKQIDDDSITTLKYTTGAVGFGHV